MLDLKLGALLLFLVPGLCAFSALYGLFGDIHIALGASRSRGRAQRVAFAPVPPAANSLKAATVVVLASLMAHAVTAAILEVIGGVSWWVFNIPAPFVMAELLNGAQSDLELTVLLLLVLCQGFAAYALVRWQLHVRARNDRLPRWLYGWTAELANLLDNDAKSVVAVVLTTGEIEQRPPWAHAPARRVSLAYIGIVHDIGIGEDGTTRRITLEDAQRFAIDLTKPFEAIEPLASFEMFTIDAPQIRNLTFEIYDASEEGDLH